MHERPPSATRISLTTRGSIVVHGSPADVRRALDTAGPGQAVHFQPHWFEGQPKPEPVAVMGEHVSMQADATPKTHAPAR